MSARLFLALGLASALAGLAVPASFASRSTTLNEDDSWSNTWQSDDEKGIAYAIVDPADMSTFTYGQQSDFNSVEIVRADKKPVLWARIGNKRYLIEDAQTFRQAKEIVDPLVRISREQGRLGSLQGELGHEQGKLGHVQGQIGREQGQLGAQQAKLAGKQSAAALKDDEEAQEALQEKQEEIGDRQNELGRTQSNLGKHQATMGETQAQLGKKQAELGEQTRKLQPEVNAKMKQLVQDAVKDGRARRI